MLDTKTLMRKIEENKYFRDLRKANVNQSKAIYRKLFAKKTELVFP